MAALNRNRQKKRFFFILLVVLIALQAFAVMAQNDELVYVLSVDGEITPAMAAFLENKIDEANAEAADAIIIEMRTLGGRVDAAIDMRDAIIASQAPVTVYVESRAISAGALITIAAETIVMAPGSHIGSAKPQPDDSKTVAFVSGEFRTTAERTGRDPEIAVAMVNENIEIEGLVASGEILDLTANEAQQYGYADHVISGRDAVLEAIGHPNATVVVEEPDFRIRIAHFLTSYEVSSLLLSLGMIALIAEFYTEGFGISGILGISFFVLYFSSGLIAGYTDLWSVVIFFAGIILVIIELTMPGFGVFGISGLLAMIIGIVLAAPSVRQGVFSMIVSILATIIAIPILIKVFGKTRFVQRLVLDLSETVDRGYVHVGSQSSGYKDLVGQTGKALTILRPSGTIRIDGSRLDGIAVGEFIDAGASVRVIRVEGSKIIVEPVETQEEESPPEDPFATI